MSLYQDSIGIPRPNYLGSGHWQLKLLNHITVLFGKNGSGKSVLLRAWRDNDVDNVHYIIPERIGTLDFESRFLDHQISQESRKQQSAFNYSDSYRQQVISRVQTYFMARGATRESILPGNPKDLEELLKSLLPDFSILLQADRPPYVIERLSTGEPITNINKLSSGESQLLTIAIDLLTISAIWDVQKKARRVILIDEPDAHLHPDLQIRFADFLLNVADKFQVQIVVSTHSTTLLSAIGQFAKQRSSVIYINRVNQEYRAINFTQQLKELSACLGGHVLMGPLFGAPLLLVEGDDDYRIWSQVPRHGVVNFAVIPANGEEIKNYQQLLEKLFSSIADSRVMGHALIDGDKSLPEPSVYRPQTFIPFVQLNCHESENLFLTDEVLSDLGLNWDKARELIKENAKYFGSKQQKIEELVELDRRTADVKPIINEISKICDQKNVHWTTRVGNRIGREKPVGQLASFLGDDVLQALWI